MKKIILNILLLASIASFSQSSRFRVKNNTKFGWTQKMVPVKMYSDSTWDAVLFKEDLPDFGNGYWSLDGNALTNTTSFLGTTNNTSLFLKTNYPAYSGYTKVDSIGNFVWRQPNSSGFDHQLFQLSDLKNSGFGVAVPTIYFGVKEPSSRNYFAWSDSLITRINAPQTIQLLANNMAWLTASPANPAINSGRYIHFVGINSSTTTLTGNKTHIFIAGCVWGFSATTAVSPIKIAIVADTYSAAAASVLPLAITLDVPRPIASTNVVITNSLAIRVTGNYNFNGNGNFGAATLTPSATIHVGGQTTTNPLMFFTSGSLLTTTVTGSFERNSGILYWTNTTMRTEVGQILKGSATLNFPSTIAGAVSDLTIAVTNAALNDVVSVGAPNGSMTATGSFYAWVSAADVVTVRFLHASLVNAEDPASGTFKVTVSKN